MTRTRSDFSYLWGAAAGQPTDPYDPAGQFLFTLGDWVGYVRVSFVRGGVRFCDAGNLQALTETWTDPAVVQGDGTAQRARGYTLDAPYACSRPGYDPCNIWGGSQTVVVTPTAAKLVLTADRSEVLAGETVTFTASTTDGSSFTVREWIWVSDVEDGGGVASRASTRRAGGMEFVTTLPRWSREPLGSWSSPRFSGAASVLADYRGRRCSRRRFQTQAYAAWGYPPARLAASRIPSPATTSGKPPW